MRAHFSLILELADAQGTKRSDQLGALQLIVFKHVIDVEQPRRPAYVRFGNFLLKSSAS